jgi:acyl CoA:acetate/3-ketoacid CoA transferase
VTGTPVLAAADAVDLIRDDAVVSVSSSSGLGCPDDVLAALGRRFEKTSSPTNLTLLHPIAAGDMYGIKGIDHIAKEGLIRRVFAGSYPSGPSKMDPPLIRTLIESGAIEAYNIPSGVLFQMHRAAAAKQPGILTGTGLGTYADPRLQGARMNDAACEFVEVVERGGQEWLFYPSIPVDVAIIRATTADDHGNLSYEHEGSRLGALDQAYAAHNNGGLVIAQVKRISDAPLPSASVHVPGILVDAIVVDPEQRQTTQTTYDPALSGEVHRDLDSIEPVAWGLEKIISRRAAAEIASGDIVNLGFGISANVPRILLEEGDHDKVTWVIEQGAVGGFPLTGFAFGCALNPQAIMQSADQFTLLAGGGFDVAMLSFLEVSARGDVNVSHLPSRPHVTAGVGGFADITTHAPRLVFSGYFTAGRKDIAITDGVLEIRQDGDVAKFVPEVAQVTFSGEMGSRRGQDVIYVTERAVLRLIDGRLTVVEIAPGVDLDRDVLARAEIELEVSDELKLMDARLFTEDGLGLELRPRRRTLPGQAS